jgi:hypothetical protein
MVEWFAVHLWATGVVTLFLMWSDWSLTILQERERRLHYAEHYESYPVNTIEGSPLYQSTVKAGRILEPKHFIPAIILSTLVAVALIWIPQIFRVAFIGYVWGLFLIVITTHLGNLFGYRAGRRGLHGKLFLHLRTGYLMQMGRYLALAAFLIMLSVFCLPFHRRSGGRRGNIRPSTIGLVAKDTCFRCSRFTTDHLEVKARPAIREIGSGRTPD